MGQHVHVRVCVNGEFLYNRGGKPATVLFDRALTDIRYNPLDDIDPAKLPVPKDEVYKMLLILIRRSPGKRIRVVEQFIYYHFEEGNVIYREVRKPFHKYCVVDDLEPESRTIPNFSDRPGLEEGFYRSMINYWTPIQFHKYPHLFMGY